MVMHLGGAIMLLKKGGKKCKTGELQNKSKVNHGFFLLIDCFYMKTEEANLIYISAHVCLSVASGGSLISCNWKDGFFKMSL